VAVGVLTAPRPGVRPSPQGGNPGLGKGRDSRRRSSSGASGGSRRRPRRIPQFPQKKPAAPVPETPFQPGAPPAPLLPVWQVAALGALVLINSLWSLLNRKEKTPKAEWQEFVTYDLSPVNTPIEITWRQSRGELNWVSCGGGFPSGLSSPANVIEGTTGGIGTGFTARGFIGSDVFTGGSGPGTVESFQADLKRQDGSELPLFFTNAGGTFPGGGLFGLCGSRGKSGSIARVRVGGVEVQPPAAQRPDAPPAAIPDLGTIRGEPDQQPDPAPVPEVLVFPQDVGVPFSEPQADSGEAPDFTANRLARVAAPAAQPGRAATPQPASPVTATGVRPQLPPAVPNTPTGTTFLPGGRPLAPNGPAPNLPAMAQEMGKLEQKLEMLLNPEDALSPLDLLNRVIDQVENIEFLLERLFPPEPYSFGAGAYQLQPVCERGPDGGPAPPLLASWEGGEGEFVELRQRLDALAELIQHHKTAKQPTCGGRGNGPASNVTVHFESD
jgi:hypothetical protein